MIKNCGNSNKNRKIGRIRIKQRKSRNILEKSRKALEIQKKLQEIEQKSLEFEEKWLELEEKSAVFC